MLSGNPTTSSGGINRRSFAAGVGASLALASLSPANAVALPRQPAPSPQPAAGVTTSSAAVSHGVKAALSTPPFAATALNRLTFGPQPGDVATFEALGNTDEERLAAFVDQQLNPGASDPVVAARLSDPAYTTLNKTFAQLWQDHKINANSNGRYRPIDEVARAVFVRTTYSQWQLAEVLADFWHNHFNVYGRDLYAAPTWVSYDRDVIRAHMLGNFRTLLEATAKSAAMLYYLDNYTNSDGGPNENYARELFELHTLGIENYYGLIPQSQVPVDDQNRPLGYVDEDIYEATRCFTGWKVSDHPTSDAANGDTGLFFYYASWHDNYAKNVLGQYFAPFQVAEVDGKKVLDLLASHPGTARHIAGKLCRRLISDHPPQTVIDAAAGVFLNKWQDADQLKEVVRTIILHPDFRNTPWGGKVKRPFETIVGALRACEADFTVIPNVDDNRDEDSDTLWNFVGLAGQRPYHWVPPDGYPDQREVWQGSTSLIQSWRAVDWLIDRRADQPDALLPILQTTFSGLGQPVAGNHTPDNLADFWVNRILGYVPADLFELMANFMAQPSNNNLPPWPRNQPIGNQPDSDGINTDSGPHYWFSRLRAMIGLILSSPYAMQR
jgi:uncharacterized protein (DUF1800 family)